MKNYFNFMGLLLCINGMQFLNATEVKKTKKEQVKVAVEKNQSDDKAQKRVRANAVKDAQTLKSELQLRLKTIKKDLDSIKSEKPKVKAARDKLLEQAKEYDLALAKAQEKNELLALLKQLNTLSAAKLALKEGIEKKSVIEVQGILPFATHGLLIFLDDFENDIGAISDDLLNALTQKAAPILTSASLLGAIHTSPALSKLVQDDNKYKDLEEFYKKITKRISELLGSGVMNATEQQKVVSQLNNELRKADIGAADWKGISAFMREDFVFNPTQWIVKIADKRKALILLIPKNYINSLNNVDLLLYKPLPKKLNVNDPLTPIEYQTGFKIDHMDSINNYTELFPLEYQPAQFSDYFMDDVWPRKTGSNSSDIFVSQAEYANSQFRAPRWAIYATGHGNIADAKLNTQAQSIGLSLSDFSLWLDFMNTKLNTSVFVYDTCFAVGVNIESIYMTEKQITKTYSFVIITRGITDYQATKIFKFPPTNLTVEDVDFKQKKVWLYKTLNFSQFVKNFTTVKEIDNFAQAVSPIISKEAANVIRLPQIRLKGRDFFDLDDAQNKIANLGHIFAKTCSKVDMVKYFTKKGITPTYYLMYSPIIPCEFFFGKTKEIPRLVPMSNAKLFDENIFIYSISKITAPFIDFDGFIAMTTEVIPYAYKARFWIDTVDVLGGKFFPEYEQKQITVTDVIIDVNNTAVELELKKKYDELIEEHKKLSDEKKEEEAKKADEEIKKMEEFNTKIKQEVDITDRTIKIYFTYDDSQYALDVMQRKVKPEEGNYLERFSKEFELVESYQDIKESLLKKTQEIEAKKSEASKTKVEKK